MGGERPSNEPAATRLVLGLDIGTTSVGWALIRYDASGPRGLERLGVRIFEAGVDGFGTPKEASRAAGRRQARGMRRQIMRRRVRRMRVYALLSRHGLLPAVNPKDRVAVRTALDELDRELVSRHCAAGDDQAHQTLPYRLRARGLDHRLATDELGRALYHLGQRRGFRSNRRTDRKAKENETSVVKEGISFLRAEMQESGARTLGEYLSRVDPHAKRIRQRYTDRSMFQEEFESIRDIQAPLHPELPEAFWRSLERAIFHQRPLRSSKHLVGKCDLEPRRARAPLYTDLAQRARMLQNINDLRISVNGDVERKLTAEERERLISALSYQSKLTWAGATKVLGFKRGTVEYNLARGGRERLEGHATAERLRSIVGAEKWDGWSSTERDLLASRVESTESPDVLRRMARKDYGMTEQEADLLSEVKLPQGYARFSRRALRRILPHLEQGLSTTEAQDLAYPNRRLVTEVLGRVPPVRQVHSGLRNPTVARALSEVRKVVNELIVRFGKPDLIRIELARDLKQGKKARDLVTKRNNAQRKRREEAKRRILEEIPEVQVSGTDIEKVLLADECRWVCPYTGRGFGMSDLFGSTPTMDVEHIVPFSRCFDNSFANKTLCDSQENRHGKRNRTPFEAYGLDPTRFQEILDRVKRFDATYAPKRTKLDRFRAASDEEWDVGEFVNRQLVDTAYAARLAAELLSPLYGGEVDADGFRRIQPTNGRVTAMLRRQWGTETLLRQDGGTGKSRDDHRHHALDAAVVALTTHGAVQRLSRAAQDAERQRLSRILTEIPPPWESLRDDLSRALRPIVVSHRVNRKLNGALHEEKFYSVREGDDKGWRRCAVQDIEEKHLSDIRDPVLARNIRDWIAARRPAPGPVVNGRNGTCRVVRHVRVRANRGGLVPLGEAHRRRYVAPGSNHHMEVFRVVGKKGGFSVRLVTRLNAMERLRAGRPVVDRNSGPDHHFCFSLHPGDCIGRPYGPGWEVVRVTTVTHAQWGGIAANDARPTSEVKEAGAAGGRIARSPVSILKAGYVKVDISPTGLISRSHE